MISYVKYCVQYSTVLEIIYNTPTLSGGKEKAFFIIDPLTLPPVQLPWPARVSKWKDDLPVQERVDFERGLISTTREQEIV